MIRQVLTDRDINIEPNCHAEYFTISDDGELSLKPEYRGAATDATFTASVSDMGAGAAGSLNEKLPANLIIPEVVDEIAVDRLASGMFMDNKVIESLTFPVTVDEIPERLCSQTVNLRYINNTGHIKKIGANAFRACRLEKVMFPNLEEISGSLAFVYNPHLVYADLGKITDIPANTFTDALALTKVKAENVKTVQNYAFLDTPRLINADFISSLTSIGKCAFWRTNVEFDWGSLTNCSFGTDATPLQVNPTDFWSGINPVACENPLPTKFCQKDDRWVNREIDSSGVTYKGGCFLVSGIHAYCGLNNLSLSSVTEFEDIVNAVNPELLSTFDQTWLTTKAILEGVGLTFTRYGNYNEENLTALYEALINGGYAIVQVGTTKGHIITIYGVNEKKELLCIDSEKKYFYDSTKPAVYTLPFHKLIDDSVEFFIITK